MMEDIVEEAAIRENIKAVERIIADECQKAGRAAEEVTLIAVSKTKPAGMLLEAYECGCRDFGENKVQELMDKYEALPKDIRWHMIGHLQRNKVKYIVGKVYMIHSVDSLRLAEEISREAAKKNVCVNILIEVNVAGEETKFGVSSGDVLQLVRDIANLSNICIRGLMTVAPFVEDAEKNRIFFNKLRKIAVDIMDENIDNINMHILSMGMTGDYSTAISEGATHVRIGTGIFGVRQYQELS